MSAEGRFTHCDLGNLTPLCMPWAEVNTQMRPVFSRDAARLSLELAAAAYDMDLSAWREAGWHDFSYQVDNTLLTGPNANGGQGKSGMITDYYQFLTRSRLRRQNPISQIRGTLRQKEASDTCKAVVMLHGIPGGKYLVAIGFMGTGKRVYDWISNFRIGREEGMHAGFLQLTRQFEMNCDAIVFPETAKEIGAETLTLNQILLECRKPGSRFKIWLAGHSQGGAVMQLFTYREIQKGLLRQNLTGYSFASPSAVYGHPSCDLTVFPLYHIINADDVFPRTGAAFHIGRCEIMFPDERMRKRCYGEAESLHVFRALRGVTRNVTNTGDAFLIMLAAVLALQDIPLEDAISVLSALIGSIIPDMFLPALGARREDLLRPLIQKLTQGYALASGGSQLPQAKLQSLRVRMADLIVAYDSKAFSSAFLRALGLPHKLRGEQPGDGLAPYQYIVNERFDELRQLVWCAPCSRMAGPVTRKKKRFCPSRFSPLQRLRCCRTT